MKLVKRLTALAALVMLITISLSSAALADYRIANAKWHTEGTGFIEADNTGGLVRFGAVDSGWFRFKGVISDDGVEWLTGYEFHAKLDVTLAGLEMWDEHDERDYEPELYIPVPKDFSPTVNDPFHFHPIDIDGISYTFCLTNENSGFLSASGSRNGVTFAADNIIWREGTPKPALPDEHSGCAAAPSLAALAALAAIARRRALAALFAASLLVLCAGPALAASARTPADVRDMPQKVSSYLPADADAPIMDAATAAEREREFVEHFLAPWTCEDTSYLDTPIAAFVAWQESVAKKAYWDAKARRIPAAEIKKTLANAAIDTASAPERAIVCEPTDIRVLPTSTPYYPSSDSARGARGLLKQDTLQNSALKPGEPLAVWSRSRDRRWLFVSTESCMGWIKESAAAFVDAESIARISEMPRAVAVRDDIKAKVGGRAITIKLGAILPTDGKHIYAPVRGKDGRASIAPIAAPEGSFERFPIRFTPRSAARAGDQLIGEPYGWGGSGGARDCSMMTRDYFAQFGVWIPRNSGDQAGAGRVVLTKETPVAEREALISRTAVPFATIIHIPGHIMLYIGDYKGRPAVLHNMWGVRLKAPKGKAARLPIGRALITSLRFAEELKDRAPNALFISNVDAIATPIYAPEDGSL